MMNKATELKDISTCAATEGKTCNHDCIVCELHVDAACFSQITHKAAQKNCFSTSCTVLLFTLTFLGGCSS